MLSAMRRHPRASILAVVFAVFGLLAPRNAVVNATIVICAGCVASAVFLINDYDSPLDGILHVSSQPMRETLSQFDAPRVQAADK